MSKLKVNQIEPRTGDAVSISGDLNAGNNALVVDSTNGNVGIGTSSTLSRLHVHGSFSQTAENATVPFEWTVNPGAFDYYKLNSVGYADNIIVASASGNVGIGTDSPLSKLVVVGRVDITGSLYVNGTPKIGSGDLIRTLSTLRNATKDETTLEGLRDAIGNAIGGLIEEFEAMQSEATEEEPQ